VGIGTVLYAVSIGPLTHLLLSRLAIRAGTRPARALEEPARALEEPARAPAEPLDSRIHCSVTALGGPAGGAV
jgi:hypothetical protein